MFISNVESYLVCGALGSLETIMEVGMQVNLSHIMMDWLNRELYYVEESTSGYKVYSENFL